MNILLILILLITLLSSGLSGLELIEQTSCNTGIAPEKGEEVFCLLAQALLDLWRSN